jgi:hypothetical protein
MLSATLGTISAQAQAPGPAERWAQVEAVVHLKVLSYDRTARVRAGGKISIAVLYRPGNAQSEKTRTQMADAFRALAAKMTLLGVTPTVVTIPFEATKWPAPLETNGITVLYLTPGLEDQTATIMTAVRRLRIPTITRDRDAVIHGAAMASVSESATGPKITINLREARALGMEFEMALLRMAEVIR